MAYRLDLLHVIVYVVIRLDERAAVIENRTHYHAEAEHVAEDGAYLLYLHLRR